MVARVAAEIAVRVRDLTMRGRAPAREIAAQVQIVAPSALVGVGPVTSAKIVAEGTDLRRYDTHDAFVCHSATVFLPVRSGNCAQHRLSRTGIRQRDAAIRRIAVTKMRRHDLPRVARHAREHLHRSARRLQRRLDDIEDRALPEDTRFAPATCLTQAA